MTLKKYLGRYVFILGFLVFVCTFLFVRSQEIVSVRLIGICLASLIVLGFLFFFTRRMNTLSQARMPSFRSVIFAVASLLFVWVFVNSVHTYLEERDRHIREGQLEVERIAKRIDAALFNREMEDFAPVVRDVASSDSRHVFFISPTKTIVPKEIVQTLHFDDAFADEVFLNLGKPFVYHRGKSNVMVFTSRLEDDWYVVVTQKWSAFFAPVRRILIENLFVAFLMFVVTFVFLHRLFSLISQQQSDYLSAIEEQLRLKTLFAEESLRAEKAKSTFLATMSHEIRTPINSIVGFAEFLKDESSEKDRSTYIDGILKSSNALLALINNILDLSKLESGYMHVRGGACQIPKLYEEMQSIFFHLANKKNVRLVRLVSTNVPDCLALREERIRQILINLIGNSVKFTPSGSVVFQADWKADASPAQTGTLILTVSDTGLGIGPEQANDLFNPFHQDGSVRGGKVYQSTGLGLPICKRLVEAAGGTITFTSELNKGTTFVITIPNVERGKPEEVKPALGQTIEPVAKNYDNLRVIIVDDVPLNLMIASRQVERLGVPKKQIQTFVDSVDALEVVRKKHHGLTVVFTDVWMPRMNGEMFAKKIRADVTNQKIFIYALTADSDSETSFDVSVFDDVLLKPVTGAMIAGVLMRSLSKKK